MHLRRCLSAIPVLLSVAVCRSAEIPVPPSGSAVFPEFRFADSAAARALFQPMEGSLPVSLERTDGVEFVRLPVNFEGTNHSRASWDLAVKTDLAVARGIQFDFYAVDSSPVANFVIYFHSGNGWYRAGFGVEDDGRWERITIDKSTTGMEDAPGGWGNIDTIRISCWRGADRMTECAIANLGAIGTDAEILVVRADSCVAANNRESKGYSQYAESVASCLTETGLSHALISDVDVTEARLKGCKLLILPYNPRLPEGLLSLLQVFADRGGRIFTFYSLAEGIPELLQVERGKWASAPGGRYAGFVRTSHGLEGQPSFVGQGSWCSQPALPIDGKSRTVAVWRDAAGNETDVPAIVVSDRGAHVGHVWLRDDWDNKKALLLALVGGTVPGVWQKAAAAEFARIGQIAGNSGLEGLRAALGSALSPEVQAKLAAVVELQSQAKDLMNSREWSKSIAASQAAARTALEAWCLTRSSEPGEHRAFWCHSAFGVAGKTWDEAIKQLHDCGFTAILPNMLWGGTAYYRSSVLPVYDEFGKKGDQIDACLAACRKYGVECHIWKVNWNMSSRVPAEFVANMRDARRVQVGRNGEVKERWLCPSHPENQKLEIEAMLEVARNYAVDGIHFDYIRYPDGDHCFCDGCRERFETFLGHRVANWPDDCGKDGPDRQAWLDFRRSNINTVVRTVAEEARKIRPGIKISAAVFRNWPVDRDGVGQDWKLWCDNGWLDFVCPMDYTESNATFRNQVRAQVEFAGKVPVYPGIGLSCWSDPQDVVKLVEQIEICRKFGTGGFTIFQYDARMESVLPMLHLGATR